LTSLFVLLFKREYLVFSHHLNQHRPVFIKTLGNIKNDRNKLNDKKKITF
jgi:hypothetical protein